MRVTRDQLVMLCDVRKHPAAPLVERRAAAVARRFGLLDPATEARFHAFNTLTGHVYPTATVERAVVCAQWCNWLFFFDDAHDERDADAPAHGDPAAKIRAVVAALADPERCEPALLRDPLVRYGLDFRAAALRLAGPEWFARFLGHVDGYLVAGTLPACVHWHEGTVPGLDEYLVQRDYDSAVETAIDLIELAHGIALPAEVHADPVMLGLRAALVRTVALFNDIVSYPKEVLRQGNPNNLVHVLVAGGRAYPAAIGEALRLVNDSARECGRLGDLLIARHGAATPDVARFVAGTRHWQTGNIESSLVEPRYRAAESPFDELRPCGS